MIRDARQGNSATFEEIAALLAKYGADEDFTRRTCITVARKDSKLNARVFTKGTNDWNRYTLLELIATVFANPNESPARSLRFPDLSRVTVRRLGAERRRHRPPTKTPIARSLWTWRRCSIPATAARARGWSGAISWRSRNRTIR